VTRAFWDGAAEAARPKVRVTKKDFIFAKRERRSNLGRKWCR